MPASQEPWLPHLPTDTSLPLASSLPQIDALQLLRAVAVILVIWCHAGQFLGMAGSSPLPGFNVFGIDIFFVISGFILSLTVLKDRSAPGLRPMRDFLKRRIIRIYPIYWFVAVLTLARTTLAHHLFEHNYVAAFFLLPSLHYPGQDFIVNFSWTLTFEVFFYLVLGLVLLFTVKGAVPTLIFLLLASIFIGAILGIRHPVAILVANPILFEFVFGAAIAMLYSRLGRRRLPGILITLAGIAAAFFLQSLNLPSIANGEQMILLDNGIFARIATWGICAALIVGGIVFWSPSMKNAPGRLCVLLGNASYSTYISSAFFLEFSFRFLFKLDPPPSFSTLNRFFLETSALLIVLLGGSALYTLVEKPILRRLQGKFLQPSQVHPSPASTQSAPSSAYPAS